MAAIEASLFYELRWYIYNIANYIRFYIQDAI